VPKGGGERAKRAWEKMAIPMERGDHGKGKGGGKGANLNGGLNAGQRKGRHRRSKSEGKEDALFNQRKEPLSTAAVQQFVTEQKTETRSVLEAGRKREGGPCSSDWEKGRILQGGRPSVWH